VARVDDFKDYVIPGFQFATMASNWSLVPVGLFVDADNHKAGLQALQVGKRGRIEPTERPDRRYAAWRPWLEKSPAPPRPVWFRPRRPFVGILLGLHAAQVGKDLFAITMVTVVSPCLPSLR